MKLVTEAKLGYVTSIAAAKALFMDIQTKSDEAKKTNTVLKEKLTEWTTTEDIQQLQTMQTHVESGTLISRLELEVVKTGMYKNTFGSDFTKFKA